MIKEWVIPAVVSLLINGVGLHYLTRYIDKKAEAEEEERKRLEKQRHDRTVAEAKRRRAAGRLFFWLHRAVVKHEANGELEAAFEAYNKAEEEQKALEQEILADVGESRS